MSRVSTAGPIQIEVPLEEIGALRGKMSRAIRTALHNARRQLERDLLEVVPFKTGRLFESMTIWEAYPDALIIKFDAPYARVVEMGAEPHEITARPGGPPLHFWWAKEGRYVTTRRVWHPGYSGRGFLARVKKMVVDTLRIHLSAAIIALDMRGRP